MLGEKASHSRLHSRQFARPFARLKLVPKVSSRKSMPGKSSENPVASVAKLHTAPMLMTSGPVFHRFHGAEAAKGGKGAQKERKGWEKLKQFLEMGVGRKVR